MSQSQSDGWRLPQGYALSEMAVELGIEPIPLPQIGTALTALNNNVRKQGINCFAGDDDFKRMFSAICHYDEMSEKVCDSAWETINRAYRVIQQSSHPQSIDRDVLTKSLYLSSQLMDQTLKRNMHKKGKKTDEVEHYAAQWSKQMNIIVPKHNDQAALSQDASSLISGICWNIFALTKKNKGLRDGLTGLIGQIVRTLGSQEIAINVIKLVQKDDSLGEFFAEVIVQWVKEHNARGLVSSIIHELNQIAEAKAQNGLVCLLSGIAKRMPDEMIRHILVIEKLIADSDIKYWAREAGLSVMAEIYKSKVRSEKEAGENDPMNQSQVTDESLNSSMDKEDLSVKDRTFKLLTEHIYDRNAYARSYVLKIFEKLATEIRLPHMGPYLERIVSRFEDNTASVRRCAIQSFCAILNQHIFINQMRNIKGLEEQIEETDPRQQTALRLMLQDCKKILELVQKGSKICLNLLRSTLPTDTCEAIKWFYRIIVLNIKGGDLNGFPAMAVYVWSKEEKIRNEVLIAYKDIYFNDQQKPETTALGLIYLIKDCTVAEANSISKIVELIGIPNRARDEIWRFALGRNTERPIPDNTRAASISIIGMLAKNPQNNQLTDANTELLINLIDDKTAGTLVLIEVCNVLMYLRPNIRKPMENGALEKTHPLFEKLEMRLIKEIKTSANPSMGNLMNNAIRLYYLLCASPSELVTNLLGSLFKMATNTIKKSKDKGDKKYYERGKIMLSVALHAAGHAALNLAIWVECTLVPRMTNPKQKSNKKDRKESNTEMEEDELEGMFGNVDDAQYEEETVMAVLDSELCRGPFASIISFCKTILTDAPKWPEMVQCSATACIAKYMSASPTHAEEKAALLFTILQKSSSIQVRQTILAAFPDLLVRHPNIMEPWTNIVFSKLQDDEDIIRKNTLNMISDLIVKGLVKPRGRMADVATLLLDDNDRIKGDAKAFFLEFGSQGNNLINHLPDILAKLHDRDLLESDFRFISEFLFEQLNKKEKQAEQLIEKLCSRFKENDEPDVWKRVALTISVMTPNEKVIKKLIECAHLFQDKVEDLEIRDHLFTMVEKARADTKLIQKIPTEVDELEQILTGGKHVEMPQTPRKKTIRQTSKKPTGQPVQRAQRAPRNAYSKKEVKGTRRQVAWSSSDESDDDKRSADSDTEEVLPTRSTKRVRKVN